MDGQTRSMLWVVFGCVVAASLVAFFFAPSTKEMLQTADRRQMRAYRVSKLTDVQLLQFQQRAERDFEKEKERLSEDAKRFWAKRAEKQQACESNPVAKLRDPDACNQPLPIEHERIGKPQPGWETPEAFLENQIMGDCAFMRTVGEAKHAGCLPQ
jgi:hypothetical protein